MDPPSAPATRPDLGVARADRRTGARPRAGIDRLIPGGFAPEGISRAGHLCTLADLPDLRPGCFLLVPASSQSRALLRSSFSSERTRQYRARVESTFRAYPVRDRRSPTAGCHRGIE